MIDKAIKLKRKVDLCSVEIFDKLTTQQGGEILDLYRPSQNKLCIDNEPSEVNNYDESEDLSDTLRQSTISSTIPEQQFDLEKLREEIREEICEEIHEEIHQFRDEIREEMYKMCKYFRK